MYIWMFWSWIIRITIFDSRCTCSSLLEHSIIIHALIVNKLSKKRRDFGFVFLKFKMSLSKFENINLLREKAGPWAFVFSQYHYISISVLLSNDEMLYLVLTWMQLCKLESSNLPDLNLYFMTIIWVELISAKMYLKSWLQFVLRFL